jgi:hypothetical protein
MKEKRLDEHKKDDNLESILSEVNNILYPAESKILNYHKKPKYPVILIMGSARSGTTLLLQWLAESGYFSYPTNMMSRFYKAPYIGAKIQLMLTEYDHNNEISKSFNDNISYESNLGKTTGALAPHEFWYFWRRFFKFGEIQKLTDDELEQINYKEFVSELSAIENVFDKPLVMKGMNVNWHIPFIHKILNGNVLFIHVKRKPLYQIQSLLKSRKKYFGDIDSWYSFKPPEYEFLKDKKPYEQIAGQIHYTNKAIEEGLAKIDENKHLSLQYEEFCEKPESFFKIIKRKLNEQGMNFDKEYNGPHSFNSTNNTKLSDDEIQKIKQTYRNITEINIGL